MKYYYEPNAAAYYAVGLLEISEEQGKALLASGFPHRQYESDGPDYPAFIVFDEDQAEGKSA